MWQESTPLSNKSIMCHKQKLSAKTITVYYHYASTLALFNYFCTCRAGVRVYVILKSCGELLTLLQFATP